MKKLYSLISWGVIGLLLGGCGGLNTKNAPTCKKVYLLLKTADNTFFRDIEKGASENIMHKYDMIIRAGETESDVQTQLENLNNIVLEAKADSSSIAGVVITPASSGSSLIPAFKELNSLKVPIVLVDTKIDINLLSANGLADIPYVGSSNFNGGVQAGNYVITHMPDGGKILVLNGVQGQVSAMDRYNGFLSVLDSLPAKDRAKYELTIKVGNWRRTQAIIETSGTVALGNRYDAIFAANDEMALGAYQVYAERENLKRPLIVGFDGIDEMKSLISRENGIATIAQEPYKMGKYAVQLLDRILSGERYEVDNPIDTKVIE